MIKTLSVENYKSIEKINLSLGRVNVFIGENGSGKSNLLEAVAFLAAACVDELDNRLLLGRGVRIARDEMTVSAFPEHDDAPRINHRISLAADLGTPSEIKFSLVPSKLADDNDQGWVNFMDPEPSFCEFAKTIEFKTKAEEIVDRLKVVFDDFSSPENNKFKEQLTEMLSGPNAQDFLQVFTYNLAKGKLNKAADEKLRLNKYCIYSPENSSLRLFEDEAQSNSLGVKGEGLFKVLQKFAQPDQEARLKDLKSSLELVGWFYDFQIPSNLAPGEQRLEIFDRYLGKTKPIDQKSSNEGFLFLLFYFSTVLAPSGPPFFAIDNVDAALNPKLCAKLMRRLVELSNVYDKQFLLTTHNPAILDGLNLNNDDERLFVVSRDADGRTTVTRVPAPRKPRKDIAPMKLSQAFLDGLIGGLPKNF